MSDTDRPTDFIRNLVLEDVAAGRNEGKVLTRFPPEPNGYLHIGHAKSICLNFGIAEQFGGKCFLRFDDTNPGRESVEYKEAIKADVHWLGFSWETRLTHASDYFDMLYGYAVNLIEAGKAYVDSLSAEEIRQYRGTLTKPGRNSPHRDRPVVENLGLLEGMKKGDFANGEHVLRAKIDMASPNMNMRDPTIYRIRRETHHQTGDRWCIYPMYDFTHCISDALELITHSLCTLEFEDHRPLYDWFLDQLDVPCHPQQIEFARLNINYTVMSKRKLNQLVADKHVDGWDDPRMLTLSGLRRRGYSPESIRDLCARIGVTKKDTVIDMSLLELCIREDLDKRARRVLGVLRPLKIVIENYPNDVEEEFDAPYHPNDESLGTRLVPFSRVLYIEKDDFMEAPSKKFFRLAPGREVRLRYAYYVTCTEVIKDPATGEVIELRCSYDPETRGGWAPDGRKVKGTLHWVSATHADNVEVRLYDRLFTEASPDAGDADFTSHLNPDSLQRLTDCVVEPSLRTATPTDSFQFERLGYFCIDPVEHAAGRRVFNRTVSLRDSWTKKRG